MNEKNDGRRRFLAQSAALVGGATSAALSPPGAAQELAGQPWERVYGAPFTGYGQPSKFEAPVIRAHRTPLRRPRARIGRLAHADRVARGHHHAERAALRAAPQRRARHRSRRAPAADPRPGRASADRSPSTRCALSDGHAHPLPRMLRQQQPRTAPAAAAGHRRARCTGSCRAASGPACRCALLLEEAGVDRSAKWLLAEGADAAAHEPQHPDGEGARRRDARAVPERRAAAPRARLSGAPAAARAGKAT